MKQTFTIPGKLPGYNQLMHGHWAARQKVKDEAMTLVGWSARAAGIKPVTGLTTIKIQCFEPNSRRDMDNIISGASKVILDSLKNMGIIQGDGQKYVRYEPCTPVVDRKNPRVEIVITEETT